MYRAKRKRETQETAEDFEAKFRGSDPKHITWTHMEGVFRRVVCDIVFKFHQNNCGPAFGADEINEPLFFDLCSVIRTAGLLHAEEVINYVNDQSNYYDDELFGPYQHAAIYCASKTVFAHHMAKKISPVDKPLVIGALITGMRNVAKKLLKMEPWRIGERFKYDGESNIPFGPLKAAIPHVNHVDKALVNELIALGAGPTGFYEEQYNILGSTHSLAVLKLVREGVVDADQAWTLSGACTKRYTTTAMLRWISCGLCPWKASNFCCFRHEHLSEDESVLRWRATQIIAVLAHVYPAWAKLWALPGRPYADDLVAALDQDEKLLPKIPIQKDELGPHARAYVNTLRRSCLKIL
jgi:hypothetical protein